MPKITLPKWKQTRRAFEVIALKQFSNFHVLKRYIFVSDRMPLPEDLHLKPNEEIVETTELKAEVVIKDG